MGTDTNGPHQEGRICSALGGAGSVLPLFPSQAPIIPRLEPVVGAKKGTGTVLAPCRRIVWGSMVPPELLLQWDKPAGGPKLDASALCERLLTIQAFSRKVCGMRDHTKLRVFEIADELAIGVYKATQSFPRKEQQSAWQT